MSSAIYVVMIVIACIVVVSLVWRLFSQRTQLPCPTWLGWMVELDNPFTKVNRAHTIIELLDLQPGMRILDAGCGPGRLTIPLAQKMAPSGEIVAMDLQEGMLQRVKQKAEASHINTIRYLHAGLGEGKLEREYYDRVVLVTVLGEIPDKVSALQEIFQALKPGGILSVTEVIFDPHFLSQKTVINLGKQVGFELQNIYGRRLAYTMHLIKP